MNWVQKRVGIAGILMPDIKGDRMFYHIESGEYFNFGIQKGKQDQDFIEVGKFRFDAKAFEKARALLLEASVKNNEWLVIDEIGKLEIHQQTGFEPIVTELIAKHRGGYLKSKVLLIIRDTLFDEAIEHYDLRNIKLLTRDFFSVGSLSSEKPQKNSDQIPTEHIAGLLLCGGKSTRMGIPKALIGYHGIPQYLHASSVMQVFLKEVFISCTENTKTLFGNQYTIITDHEKFADAGPMTGLLSAFHRYPKTSFFVMGCDYPLFDAQALKKLIEARDRAYDAVCYYNPETGYPEPLLAVYESTCAPKLADHYQAGNRSLKKFLELLPAKFIVPDHLSSIMNINTTADFERVHAAIKKTDS